MICYEYFEEPATERFKFEKIKVKLLTNKQQKSYENAKLCYIRKERFKDKHGKDENYCKARYHCQYTSEYRGAAYRICNLKV